ncbi:hypothetical protein [Vibrio splendidus]|uniref:hypothetical protein n=1 Tax=Vibrio splendidus TaxID=29497 RepID=UPI00246918CC|nr:hypothetical protein [Vibrio splendidus]MDH5931339.1 hypothetical protein [Vibrio splendidus]
MSDGQMAVLLDCDNSRMSLEMPTLHSHDDVVVIAVANNSCRLPRVKGIPTVEIVDTYQNSADFRLIARLAEEMQHRDIADVIMVTADRALARAVQEYANLCYINCQCYPNVTKALMNDRLLQAMMFDPLNW